MWPRSSIFSFSTLAGLPRPGKAFALTVLLCGAFRVLLIAQADRLEQIPAPSMRWQYERYERERIRQADAHPKLLLMGNSLMCYGLREKHIADQLGLAADDVLNLGLDSGRAWNALCFLRRNPDLARDVQLVVYNINRHQVTRKVADKHLPFFYRYSTLAEKVQADGLGNRVSLLLDWAWPYYTERRAPDVWLAGLLGQEQMQFQMDTVPYRYAWGDTYARKWEANQDAFDQMPAIEDFDGSHDLSPLHLDKFHEFIEYWRQRQVPVVLISTPVRRVMIEGMRRVPEVYAREQAFQEYLTSLQGSGVSYIVWPTAESAGICDPDDYLDYTHLRPSGADKLTASFLAELTHRGLLPLPARQLGEPAHLAQRPTP